MGRDTRRVAAPDNCSSPNAYRQQKKIHRIINSKGLRKDGRTDKDLRPISLKVGIVPSVTGSAYIECGKTKIICSVNGPRDVLHKSDSSTKGQLLCEFKFALFSCAERQPYLPSDEETTIAKSIQDGLEPVILLHKFPKSRLDISILVLENDGGAVSAAITCAGAALSNAGVEMYDLPIGCSLIHANSQFIVDPTAEEELFSRSCNDASKLTVAMMVEYKSQVIFMDSSGCVNPALFSQSVEMLQCRDLLTNVRVCLKQHIEETREKQEEEPSEGSLNKKMAAELKLLQPQKYMAAFLESGIRPDTRNLTEFRPILINTGAIGTAFGSALVKLGHTSVLCGVKAELTNPTSKEPNRGFFVPNVTLSCICSNQFVPGPPTEQAQVYSQLLMDLWKSSSFLDAKDLCIVPGKLAWCMFAEMSCLSYDGNVLDACVLALMAALRNTRLPEVLVDDGVIQVTDQLLALKCDRPVFSATFAIVKEDALADPSGEEESLADSCVTVFLKDDCETSVNAFGPVRQEQLLHCITCSQERYSHMKELIETLN